MIQAPAYHLLAGFSGTPSSLLPEDLGTCLFEAENEGIRVPGSGFTVCRLGG